MEEQTSSRQIGAPLPLWGGVECTVNRVGDVYFDQLEKNGHARRLDDIDRIADLGIKTLRFPMLWERLAPRSLDDIDWQFAETWLGKLQERGIEPIVGFLHHGSGPRYTDLLDPEFPFKLAGFAEAFARRFPWIRMYTPINEPLTTARFSGLYGHWYPHHKDARSFVRMLFNECRGIAQVMRAVRAVRSDALLVQTEDLGKVFSTPLLQYQADYENERRWLSFDLLTGSLKPDGVVRSWLKMIGVEDAELACFAENPCPPDIMGLNHYITSNRFLDERFERYPESFRGSNGRHRYADVEAVRVGAEEEMGFLSLLKEAWERYHLPLAVTEAHMGSTRDDQLRWLAEVYEEASEARELGIDVRAVTSWSLLGAFNWNSLVTRDDGFYEPGAFDVRSPSPRPTAIAGLVKALAHGDAYSHPVLCESGWWRRLERLLYAPVSLADRRRKLHALSDSKRNASKVLIFGGLGTLGFAFARICELRGLPFAIVTRNDCDIADLGLVRRTLAAHAPWVVINAAGYVHVDDAEEERDRCYRANVEGAAVLAQACAEHDTAYLTFSSDLVFNGMEQNPYKEQHRPEPLGIYGRSKAMAEERVLRIHPRALVIRTSAFFGPWDEHNFVTIALRHVMSGREFQVANDCKISPTYVPDLVNASLDLIIDGESGIWHLANDGAVTWEEFAHLAARAAGIRPAGIVGVSSREMSLRAKRPAYSVLGSERGQMLGTLDHALARYNQECRVAFH